MTRDDTVTGSEVLAFGPFWLDAGRRVLFESGGRKSQLIEVDTTKGITTSARREGMGVPGK